MRPSSANARERHTSEPLLIGALAPLSRPGWLEAGRQLLTGLQLGAEEVNRERAPYEGRVKLVIRDTAGRPERAAAAVEDLHRLGVRALAGEYHSVAARAAAARAESLGMPFLCSSAVIDDLTEGRARRIARLAPPQSHGWPLLAEALIERRHKRALILADPGDYWSAGNRILARALGAAGTEVIQMAAPAISPRAVGERIVNAGVTAVVLLVGYPEPALAIVRSLRKHRRLKGLMIAAPAGQPEFASWQRELGSVGAGIPFLMYMPESLGPLGIRVHAALLDRLGEPPSFIAFEGYDTLLVLAAALRSPVKSEQFWPSSVEGTRGTIRFSRAAETGVWQWTWAPVALVQRDPLQPDCLQVLRRR